MTKLVLHSRIPTHIRWVKVTNENSRGYDIGSNSPSCVRYYRIPVARPCHVIFGYRQRLRSIPSSLEPAFQRVSRLSESVSVNYYILLNGNQDQSRVGFVLGQIRRNTSGSVHNHQQCLLIHGMLK
jgi:hypothetical protein